LVMEGLGLVLGRINAEEEKILISKVEGFG
jgi:hypothetical protein